jgi:hypothetical protein
MEAFTKSVKRLPMAIRVEPDAHGKVTAAEDVRPLLPRNG